MARQRVLVMIWLLLSSVLLEQVSAQPSPPEYSFAIVPQQSPGKLARAWVPVLQYLSEKSGYKLRFETTRDIPSFEWKLSQEAFDFSYMNPYHYVVYHNKGYQALAKASNRKILGIIVVRKDSELRALDDLRASTIAFPSPNAFAASMIPRAILKESHVAFEPKYVSSHDSVYLEVERGIVKAGGGVMRTFATTAPTVRDKLKILWTSEGYTPHAFAVHQRVPDQVRKAVYNAMEAMRHDAKGRRLLEHLKLEGIEAANNADWDDIRRLPLSESD